jgi:hypothetical protein
MSQYYPRFAIGDRVQVSVTIMTGFNELFVGKIVGREIVEMVTPKELKPGDPGYYIRETGGSPLDCRYQLELDNGNVLTFSDMMLKASVTAVHARIEASQSDRS